MNPIEQSYEHHPVEDMEPEAANWRRECAERYLVILYGALLHIKRADDPKIGWYAVAFALDLIPESMSKVANMLNVERATICFSANQFLKEHNLPIPNSMRSEEASKSYRNARKRNKTVKP